MSFALVVEDQLRALRRRGQRSDQALPVRVMMTRAIRALRTGYHERVERFRRRLIREALEATGGNRAEAGRQLGLSRQALSYLVKQLQIH